MNSQVSDKLQFETLKPTCSSILPKITEVHPNSTKFFGPIKSGIQFFKKIMISEKIDIRHLNDLKNCFLRVDENRDGKIKKISFFKCIQNLNLKFPRSFFE